MRATANKVQVSAREIAGRRGGASGGRASGTAGPKPGLGATTWLSQNHKSFTQLVAPGCSACMVALLGTMLRGAEIPITPSVPTSGPTARQGLDVLPSAHGRPVFPRHRVLAEWVLSLLTSTVGCQQSWPTSRCRKLRAAVPLLLRLQVVKPVPVAAANGRFTHRFLGPAHGWSMQGYFECDNAVKVGRPGSIEDVQALVRRPVVTVRLPSLLCLG